MLYIIATPIGNLDDITFRAVDTLKNVDVIFCEDTREALKLLNHLGIKKPLVSYYRENEKHRLKRAIKFLLEGKDIALICDRGTPGVSDPAYLLVREAYKNNIPVTAVPGPSALTAAMSVCGLPTDKIVFYGFLPRKKGKKRKIIEELRTRKETIIFYESVHRIKETLMFIKEIFNAEREMTVCRELTKKFEEIKTGTVSEVYEYYQNREMKGEFVIIIKGDD
ncbi:MAG: 16S rRNA (cytidine(1402)-2'-O)-methyltransferase [Candidatus Omnitrophica bacterium]|nr:16S rRNA (cytidine(1402)-2'-O)-methyltransferase [Candidatus Omnitrophota bacterium]MCM8829766.1 16S rRNA (cytidine(1402)-2'-O)-methyltransferase [Candidatus Omnitrophota bacterium]